MQDRNVVDKLIYVVRPVELGEAGAAPQTSIEALECDIRKTTIRFCVVVGAAEPKRETVTGLSVGLAGTVRSIECLVEVVRAKPEGIDYRGVRDVVPLCSDKKRPRLVGRPPVGLDDGCAIGDQPPVRADKHLAVDCVLLAEVKINLRETIVHAIVGVKARENLLGRS